ncbi:molybdopterin synthase [Halorubrum laminariae]|uniref:Molybdopterin synthase n=1 Tax=Halorubrum laminariae TaxID=1433523 RepID=A0ABD6BWH0_9EURY|nr:molybdopterin synthase [Halorubrum laminariae]
MQPISILGSDAADLAALLPDRLDGQVAVVDRRERADGGVVDARRTSVTGADSAYVTEIALDADGSWTGSGRVDGIDDVLDDLAPTHDYLIVLGESRLRVPVVLLSEHFDADDVPGPVLATARSADDVDLDKLAADLADAGPWITRETLVRRVEASADADRSGAIATFTGRVRQRDAADDDRTTHLAFEKYEGVAADRMDAIAAELTERDGVFDVRMHHRTGVIEAGEDIVFVVVLAGHRREAFRAVEDGIDRLKDEVPIFKKETTEAEEFWVHQRE